MEGGFLPCHDDSTGSPVTQIGLPAVCANKSRYILQNINYPPFFGNLRGNAAFRASVSARIIACYHSGHYNTALIWVGCVGRPGLEACLRFRPFFTEINDDIP